MSNATVAPADLVCETSSLDQFFLVIMGMIVFFLQAGFAFLEAGTITSKNVTNILFKNVMDVVVGSIAFFLFGYAFSNGGDDNDFIGTKYFALSGASMCDYASFFFQYTFAATATTIVSGAIAERARFITYFVYSFFITGFIYPVVVYWTWSGNAWLARGRDDAAFTDFAGSAIVHMTGGAAALVATILIGPRLSRVGADGKFIDVPPHSTPLAALGGFILAFGFFAFNAGSVLAIDDNTGELGSVAALAAVNTILAGAGSSLTATMILKALSGSYSLMCSINGMVGGMVAICAGAGSVMPWAALVIGIIAGAVYILWSFMLVKLKIDDAIDAIPVHLGCGWWGVMAQPIFEYQGGFLYAGKTDVTYRDLAWNLAGSLTIFVWTVGMSLLMFLPLKMMGVMRVDEDVETDGLDEAEHKEVAYFYSVRKWPFEETPSMSAQLKRQESVL